MEETVLYRHYDEDDIPIYYGISGENETRQGVHDLYSVWWPFSVRCEEETFSTRKEAEAAERAAIQADRPIFNRLHNGADCIDRAVEYLAKKGCYDLLQPRSPRAERRPKHDAALVAYIESKPMSARGTRSYDMGGQIPWGMTDEEAYAYYEHGDSRCPCPVHGNLPIRRFS